MKRLVLAVLALTLLAANTDLLTPEPEQCDAAANKAANARFTELLKLDDLLLQIERNGSAEARALAKIMRRHVRVDIGSMKTRDTLKKRGCSSRR